MNQLSQMIAELLANNVTVLESSQRVFEKKNEMESNALKKHIAEIMLNHPTM